MAAAEDVNDEVGAVVRPCALPTAPPTEEGGGRVVAVVLEDEDEDVEVDEEAEEAEVDEEEEETEAAYSSP